MKEQPTLCALGCGRYVLPSRAADHSLFARFDHLLAEKQADRTNWALAVLKGEA